VNNDNLKSYTLASLPAHLIRQGRIGKVADLLEGEE
jgi:hypothetical protein